MNRWKFAFLSAGDHAKIKGQIYTIDEKIYKKQKKVTTTLSLIFIVFILVLLIIYIKTKYDIVLLSFIGFVVYFILDYLFNVFLIPKDIKNYVTLKETEVKSEADSIGG